MPEIPYERLQAIEALLGGRTAIEAAHAAGKSYGAPGSVVSDPSATVAGGGVTKRVTLPISADGGSGTLSSNTWSDVVQRWLVTLPVTTTRWRLRVRNFAARTQTAYANAITFAGIAIGTPNWPSGAAWDGSLAAVATALGAFSTPADGSEYTSAWVTDASLQMSAHIPAALSVGWTAPGGTTLAYSSYGVRTSIGSGKSALFNGSAALTLEDSCIFDIRLEYEYVDVLDRCPVVLAIGDSITRGVVDDPDAGSGGTILPNSGGIFQYQAWPGAAGLRHGFVVANLAVGGSNTSDWTDRTHWLWARADLTTTVPEAAFIALGTNDAASGVALATIKSNLQTIIANCRTLGIQRIFLGTQIPRNFTLPTTYEVDTLATSGTPTGGTLILRFTLLGRDYTVSVNYNATAADVATAIQAALPLDMPNSVVGTGGPLGSGTVTLTFQNRAIGPISNQAVTNLLTGGSSPSATFAQSVSGDATNSEVLRVSLNNWIRQLPSGISGAFDFDQALRLESEPEISGPDLTTHSQIHPSPAGYQKMASIVALR